MKRIFFKIIRFKVGFYDFMDIISVQIFQGAKFGYLHLYYDYYYSFFECISCNFYGLIKWMDMSKESDLSKHGSCYEIFMHRAYGTNVPTKPEMQASVMQNLIIAEKTSLISNDLVTYYEDQLTQIKLHMGKAIDKYIAKPTTTKRLANTLTAYKTDLIWAISSDELLIIVYNIIHVKGR